MRRTVEATAFLQVPRDTVRRVLHDVESASDWLPFVERCSLMAQSGGGSVVDVAAPGLRAGSALIDVDLAEEPVLAFREVGRYRGAGIRGSISASAAADGTEVTLRLSAQLPGLGILGRRRVREVGETALHALDAQCQRVESGLAGGGGRKREKILEVRMRDDHLDIWVVGHRASIPLRSE